MYLLCGVTHDQRSVPSKLNEMVSAQPSAVSRLKKKVVQKSAE